MNDNDITPLGKEVLFDFLGEHKVQPSVPGVDWAQGNWHNLQSIVDRMVALQKDC